MSQLAKTVTTAGLTVGLALGALACSGSDSFYAAPEGAPYDAEDVVVTTPDGLTLAGTLTLPHGVEHAPALLMITGSGKQDRDEYMRRVGPGYRPFRQIADTASRRGVATLRLDDRGVGGSDAGPEGASVFDEVPDYHAAVAFLRSRPEIDPDRIAVLGHSEGGVVAPIVASEDPRLAGLVLLAGPAYTFERVNRFQRRQQYTRNGLTDEQIETELARTDQNAKRIAMENPRRSTVWDYSPLPTARTVAAPVLLLHGDTDVQISPEQLDTLAVAFREGGNLDVTAHLFEDTNHMFLWDDGSPIDSYQSLPSHQVTTEVLGVLADWLADRLVAN